WFHVHTRRARFSLPALGDQRRRVPVSTCCRKTDKVDIGCPPRVPEPSLSRIFVTYRCSSRRGCLHLNTPTDAGAFVIFSSRELIGRECAQPRQSSPFAPVGDSVGQHHHVPPRTRVEVQARAGESVVIHQTGVTDKPGQAARSEER